MQDNFNFSRAMEIEVFSGRVNHLALRLAKLMVTGSHSKRVIVWYRLACFFKSKGLKRIATLILQHIAKTYGVYIGYKASIAYGIKLPHPTGIVIGEGVTIGENCTIYQQVTLGGARIGDGKAMNYPELGNNIVLFAGAKVIGKVKLDDNVIAGANSVVLKNVPANSVVVGIPARILERV